MKLYVDTSLLVAALTKEAKTAGIQAWLAGQDADNLAISLWVVTEFSAALSIKVRTGQLDHADRAQALATFTVLAEQSFEVLGVPPQGFQLAARFADQTALGLRAGDALHLAICALNGAELYTLDRRLSEAAPVLGVRATLL